MATQLLYCQFCGIVINQNEIKNHGNNICNKNAINIHGFNISDDFSSKIKKNSSIKDENKKKNSSHIEKEKLTELDKLLNYNTFTETKYIKGFFPNNKNSSNEKNASKNFDIHKPIIASNSFLNDNSLSNNDYNNEKNDLSNTEAAPPIMLIDQNENNKIVDDKLFNDLIEIEIKNSNKLSSDKRKCKLCNINFKNQEKAILLPCSHFFHIDHLKKWFKTHNNCPTCSLKISSSLINTPGK